MKNLSIKIKLYVRFLSLKPVGKGAGLGLSAAYGIIKEHDGIIYAESKEGLGLQSL